MTKGIAKYFGHNETFMRQRAKANSKRWDIILNRIYCVTLNIAVALWANTTIRITFTIVC